ncbi:diguanylate cyclase domain-containing protein [Spartinivicinus poritis]|uniref:diguanylate cyclase n=1 Tax=Spartinivicinus poritis TaxID=2994640 RepID=A0ABT5U3C7_9GAMM|nr:diguanylate cyclase [Spartinivicinus sp. A2-2]MDE1460866.1 diguanylate cyclase [Spartinivicinus sp. A2-2]
MIDRAEIDLSLAEILIVDDTPANLDLLYNILTHEGYQVAAAPSGVVALNIAPQIQPDLILLDVMMPDIDGFTTCQKLKELQPTKDIPVIFITAKNETADIVRGFHVGAIDYISKPIQREEVCARIKTHVTNQLLAKQRREMLTMLHDYESRNRCIINEVSDPIITIFQNGLVESVNPAALHLFHYTISELIGRPLTDFLLPECTYLINQFLTHTSTQTSLQVEVIGIRHDKSTIPLDLSIKRLSITQSLYVCLMHDLSMQKNIINELQRVSNLDRLTNIANRRRFDVVYQREWLQAKHEQSPISLIMIDIDYFKRYNDNQGHQAGDSCLQEVARAIEQSVTRPSDLAARYGGEEFIVILANTNDKGATSVANHINQNIKRLAIKHPDSLCSDQITVSMGIASTTPTELMVADQLIKAADLALYSAKHAGRNSIQFQPFE